MLQSRPKVRSASSISSRCHFSMRPQMPCQVRPCPKYLTRTMRMLKYIKLRATLRTGLRFYADACGGNRALWQDRFDAINALASTTPPPPIKTTSNESQRAISLEERYRNLFPLSLPRSMFQDSATSIGSTATTPSTQTSHSLAIDDAALSDTHSMRAAYIENTTRRTSSAHLRTPRTKRFQP